MNERNSKRYAHSENGSKWKEETLALEGGQAEEFNWGKACYICCELM